jgi:hypothetical protein
MAALTANPTAVDDDDIFLGKLFGFAHTRRRLFPSLVHVTGRGEGMTKDGEDKEGFCSLYMLSLG